MQEVTKPITAETILERYVLKYKWELLEKKDDVYIFQTIGGVYFFPVGLTNKMLDAGREVQKYLITLKKGDTISFDYFGQGEGVIQKINKSTYKTKKTPTSFNVFDRYCKKIETEKLLYKGCPVGDIIFFINLRPKGISASFLQGIDNSYYLGCDKHVCQTLGIYDDIVELKKLCTRLMRKPLIPLVP